MREEVDVANDPKWDLAWKTKVQQRVRVFLWLALHNRLLCNSIRVFRKLATDPTCKRCGAHEEDLIHLLRDCPHSKAIWDSVGSVAAYPSFYSSDLVSWLCKNLKAEGVLYSDK